MKIGKKLKKKIIANVREKFKEIEACKLLAMSTILDPRFKKIHFRSALISVKATGKINEVMKSIDCNPEKSSSTSKPPENSSEQSIWDFRDNLLVNDIQCNNDPSELHLELRQYLNQPLIPRQANPMDYWQSVKGAYPTLYPLAIKYLNVIVTSVPSERLFSKVGVLKTERRNRLSGKHLDMILFLGSLDEEDWGLA